MSSVKVFQSLLIIALSLSFSACSAKKEKILGESKLLISIEKRDFNSDTVTVFNFFDNALKQSLITHKSSSAEKLFNNELELLKTKELEAIKDFTQKLTKLDYENSFPWKEGLYDRGNVYKISFVTDKELEYLNRMDSKDKKSITAEKVLYYYQGHQDSPKLFKDLINYIEEL